MDIKDVIALVNAGYTKSEISSMYGVQNPAPAPAPAPAPEPAPAPAPATAQAPAQAPAQVDMTTLGRELALEIAKNFNGVDIPPVPDAGKILADHYISLMGYDKQKEDK